MVKKILVLILFTLSFFLVEFFFDQIGLYLVGGFVGGFVDFTFDLLNLKMNSFSVAFFWFLLLIGAIIPYYRSSNKLVKVTSLVVTALLLYLIDFVSFLILESNGGNQTLGMIYLTKGVMALLKGLIMTTIIYLQKKPLLKRSGSYKF